MSDFDTWLTTDRGLEEAERLEDAWFEYCEENELDFTDRGRQYEEWLDQVTH